MYSINNSNIIVIIKANIFYLCWHFAKMPNIIEANDVGHRQSDIDVPNALYFDHPNYDQRHHHHHHNHHNHHHHHHNHHNHHNHKALRTNNTNQILSEFKDSSTKGKSRDNLTSFLPIHFIDLTRKAKIHFNGIEIDEYSLMDHLKEHERELIFGKSNKSRYVKLVHLNYRSNGAHLPVDEASSPIVASRARRSASLSDSVTTTARATSTSTSTSSTSFMTKSTASVPATRRRNGARDLPEVSIQFKDNENVINMRLQQTPQLIDDAFVFIRRSANTSQLLEESRQLAIELEKCFYHNYNSALDLCDKNQMRGIFHHNNTKFMIQPLPLRFGNSTHIILEMDDEKYDNWWPNATSYVNDGIQFEPDVERDEKRSNKILRRKLIKMNKNHIDSYDNFNNRTNLNGQYHRYRHNHSTMPLNLRYKPRYHRHHNHNRNHHENYQGLNNRHLNLNPERVRKRRHILPLRIPEVLHIETAVFVDSDLYKHMAKNFPKNTANHLIRFVLAMINGVQLLYHHGSLGHRVNYVLKRLEILEKDPIDLRRSSDIDVYLSNFCKWQNSWNPPKDSDPFHYDHALILTGLDLYVVDKNGKVINQVVGLAPVAGMCIPTSSCTINEGKHFESVFVVAHEIGHNLGMRHDAAEISCDPSLHIMSPTLGSGKTTWSKCSKDYLNAFLEKPQAKCLFDHGKFTPNLDHGADGLLPGERFDADLQCMLKYGRDSVRAQTQTKTDICRDLHCQRDRYTWTSHPALEGTFCGDNMWCRNGHCIIKQNENYMKQTLGLTKSLHNKSNLIPNTKLLSANYDTQKTISSWSEWSEPSDCDSGCLYGPSKRLGEGSTGLRTYTRNCLDYKRRCLGRDRKYESCTAKQCYKVPIITIENFARRVCERAQKFDYELTGDGEQIVGNIEESCKIYCKTKTNGTKSRRRLFPDGTACRSKFYGNEDPSYCIQGRCEKFSCDNATGNYYKIDPNYCNKSKTREDDSHHEQEAESVKHINTYNNNIPTTSVHKYKDPYEDKYKYPINRVANNHQNYNEDQGKSRSDNGIYGPTTIRSKYENEVALRPQHNHNNHNHNNNNNNNNKRKVYNHNIWNKYTYNLNEEYKSKESGPAVAIRLTPSTSDWIVKSGCYYSCMGRSKGAQVVVNKKTGEKNIQLCTTTVKPCDRLQSANEFADNTCSRYKQKVRGLSGRGTQIAASIENPDRSCRVGCQDEYIKHRYYLVNGKHGHFPLGTKCSTTEERYCVNGKCLEFGPNNIPLQQSHISLALFRNRRSLLRPARRRRRRSFLYFDPVNITETITQDFINGIINSITTDEHSIKDETPLSDDQIEFAEPIYYCMDESIDK